MTYKQGTKLTFDEQGNIRPRVGDILTLSGLFLGLSTVLYLLAQVIQ